MSRKWLIVSSIVLAALIFAAIVFPLVQNKDEERALTLDPTVGPSPTVTVLVQPTETPNVTVATATPRPLPTATSESIASPTPTVSPIPKPTFTPTSSPTPTATPLPLELVSLTNDTIPPGGGKVEGLTVFTGFVDGILDELKFEKPFGLKDAPEPTGEAYYGLFVMGPRYALAIMADIRGSQGSTIDGTLYVGRKLDGSLAEAVSVPFESCCADAEATYFNIYDDSAPPPLDVGVFVTARNLSWVPSRPFGGPTPTPIPTPTAVPTPGSKAQYAVTVAIVTLSLRVGRIPGTEKVFIVHDTTGRGVFNNLDGVRILQDVDGDGRVIGVSPETQPANSVVLIGSADEWKIYDIAVSGKFLHLIRKEDAEAAGLVSSK